MNFKIGDRIFVRGYIDEIRKDTVIVRNDGGYFWTIPSEVITGELPSAQPERKTGRWIYGEHDVAMCDGYHCSECGFFVPWDYKRKFIDFIKDYNFCPSCGSYNGGENET